MSTFYTMDDCNRERASRGNPQDFFCLEYKSEKIIDYTFPQDKSKQGSLDNISVGPIALKDAGGPYECPRQARAPAEGKRDSGFSTQEAGAAATLRAAGNVRGKPV